MTTLRFLGCKGGRSLIKTKDFQADSCILVEGDKKILINCGEDWVDKVNILRPDSIVLTSPAPEHSYGVMKYEKTSIVASIESLNVIEPLFKGENLGSILKKDLCFGSDLRSIMPIGTKSILMDINGKGILYTPEFHCEDDVEALRKTDILIGDGYSLKDNVSTSTIHGSQKHVSMVNQISLCKKYGVDTIIFTGFGEECVKMGRNKLYKALSRLIKADNVDVTLAYHGYTTDIDAMEETLSVKQAFGSPGGKRFMLKQLMKYIPEHTTYVESFVGGGSLFFKKDPVEKEVICDKDPEIYFLYKYIQTCSDENLGVLSEFDWKSSKTLFDRLKREQKLFMEKQDFNFIYREDLPKIQNYPSGNVSEDKITPGQHESKNKRFYRLMYLKRFSDVGFMLDFNSPTEGKVHTICKRIPDIRERLSKVTIENDSYEVIIPKYDSPSTWHFIDPPYPSAKYPWKYQIQPEELYTVLKAIKGKFLLTYEVQGRKVFKGFYQRLVKLRSQANPWRGVVNKTELLVANYPFDARSKTLSKRR